LFVTTARLLQILWSPDRKSLLHGSVYISSATLFLDETGIYGGTRGEDCRVAGVGGAIEGVGKIDEEGLRISRDLRNNIILRRSMKMGPTNRGTPETGHSSIALSRQNYTRSAGTGTYHEDHRRCGRSKEMRQSNYGLSDLDYIQAGILLSCT
jgi:hypothetical protein